MTMLQPPNLGSWVMFGPGKLLMLAGGACWLAVTPAFASAFLWRLQLAPAFALHMVCNVNTLLPLGRFYAVSVPPPQHTSDAFEAELFHICAVLPIHVVIP